MLEPSIVGDEREGKRVKRAKRTGDEWVKERRGRWREGEVGGAEAEEGER